MRNSTKKSKTHRIVSGITLAVLIISVAALVLHFSWNMVMPDLFVPRRRRRSNHNRATL